MGVVNVRLLGTLNVRCDDQTVIDLQPQKAQELFAYLLLHRGRSHTREALANLIWGGNNLGQARKYLRHTLWQLHTALDSAGVDGHSGLLVTDRDWIQVNPKAKLWLDVAEFERAWGLVQGTPGHELDRKQAQTVQHSLDLYRGDLLEGWYQDWCMFERERLQQLYLALLGKQMSRCEADGDYELGLDCGNRALRCDVAQEQIHRRMMRLRYLAGDRTGALRQYQRCVAFLDAELDVEPATRTTALYERMCADEPLTSDRVTPAPDAEISDEPLVISPEQLAQLEQLQTAFAEFQHQLQETMEALQMTLKQPTLSPHCRGLPPADG